MLQAAWTPALTQKELSAAGGKKVVELGSQRVLVVEDGGSVYALSNKCSHLGLPLVGKTGLFQAEIKDGCVVCPAHGTAFNLATGAVKGEWCPGMNLPIVGKITQPQPQPTFETRLTENGGIEVNI
eukprot:scaffold13.g375.t1